MNTKNILFCVLLSCTLPAQAAFKSDTQPDTKPQQHSLIYSYDEMFNFDIEAYLASQAPHLLPYAEVISHWSGYSSISPKVLLTLIEQQSSLLTKQQYAAVALDKPFGNLSKEHGFAAQFKDVADQLAKKVYGQHAHEGASEFAGSVKVQQSGFDMLFTANNTLPNEQQRQADEQTAVFAKLYYQLFQQQFSPLKYQTEQHYIEAQAPNGFLQFPFPLGQAWHVGGAHTNTGSGSYPLSSLDMSMGGGWGSNQYNVWVAASAGGQFKRHSSCFAEIVHANGWSTTYYHLMNIQYNTGANVSKNTRFANPAHTRAQALCNGGQSTGPHLHWSLKRYGNWYHLNGTYLSGWRINAQGHSYDTNCNRFYLTKNGWWGCAGYYRH